MISLLGKVYVRVLLLVEPLNQEEHCGTHPCFGPVLYPCSSAGITVVCLSILHVICRLVLCEYVVLVPSFISAVRAVSRLSAVCPISS